VRPRADGLAYLERPDATYNPSDAG